MIRLPFTTLSLLKVLTRIKQSIIHNHFQRYQSESIKNNSKEQNSEEQFHYQQTSKTIKKNIKQNNI